MYLQHKICSDKNADYLQNETHQKHKEPAVLMALESCRLELYISMLAQKHALTAVTCKQTSTRSFGTSHHVHKVTNFNNNNSSSTCSQKQFSQFQLTSVLDITQKE